MDLVFRSFGRKKSRNQHPKFRQDEKNIFASKHEFPVFRNTKFRFENPKFRLKNPEVSVQNHEVSGKIFELETSLKVVFRNASVAETQNFELLCRDAWSNGVLESPALDFDYLILLSFFFVLKTLHELQFNKNNRKNH
jgi:hypothetical protein